MTIQDVIYADETTVQMETHRRTCCYKWGCKPRYKPKHKYSVKCSKLACKFYEDAKINWWPIYPS